MITDPLFYRLFKKLARFSRKEIQTMLQVHDIRETCVYQEAIEEGEKKKAALAIVNMPAKKMASEEIAAILEVDIEFVHQVLEKNAPSNLANPSTGPAHHLSDDAGAGRS